MPTEFAEAIAATDQEEGFGPLFLLPRPHSAGVIMFPLVLEVISAAQSTLKADAM